MESSDEKLNRIWEKLQSYERAALKTAKATMETIEEHSIEDKTFDSGLATSSSSPMSTRAILPSNKPRQNLSPLRVFKRLFSESDCDSSETPAKLPDFLKATYQENHIITEAHELQTDIETPALTWCAYCNSEQPTYITYQNSSKTLLSSIGILLFGGVLGCFLIPYSLNQCKTLTVSCSKCHHRLN